MNIEQDRKYSCRWIVFSFLFVTFILQFMTYLSWNPFIPLANTIFCFSASESAAIVAAVALGRMVFQIPGGILVDKYSAKKLLLISLTALAISCAIVSISKEYNNILVGEFLIGMAGVVVWPLCIKIIIDYFPNDESDFISGLLNVGASIAVVLINFMVPIITYRWKWNVNFYLMGIGCIILVILIYFYLDLSDRRKEKSYKKSKFIAEFFNLLKDRYFLLAISVHAGAIYTTWGINSWLAMYLSNGIGFTSIEVSQMMFYFGIFGCIGMILAGKIVQGNFHKRCIFLLSDLGIIAVLLILMPYIKNEFILYVYISFLGLVSFGHFGPLNIFVSNLIESKFLATGISVSIFIWQIASIIQALCIGKIIDSIHSADAYIFMFYILAIGAITACFSLGYIIKKKLSV